MENQEWLADAFEAHRKHLQAVAYRMLGSFSEAEDAVQESWLRLSRVEASSIENMGGWLTTVVSRVCLDMLRSRKSRREEPLEAHSPETINSEAHRGDPEQAALLADSVSAALLIVLAQLQPVERITFVLHDVFAMPFGEIAVIVGKSEAAVRKQASRARQRVRGSGTADVGLAEQRDVVQAFLAAAHAGDFGALLSALDPDAILRDDREPGALKVTRGAGALAQQVSGRAQKAAELAIIDGAAGIIVAPGGRVLYVLKFLIHQGKISEVDLISDPKRIDQLDIKLWPD